MSAKFISSLTDENPDLRKKIGCMKGIFQLFDRQHFLAGRRMISHNHKKIHLGANHNMDPKYATKTSTEKNLKTVPKEKPGVSSKLYQASDSSSSGTFTFTGCNKTAQQKAVSSNQSNIPETPSQTIIMKEQKTSFPDVVKDSMYREARSLSIKSKVKDGRRGHVMKHIDSPRPLYSLGGLQEGTKSSKNEQLALPRLSYDERESRDALKSKINLREFPRLSLDSKASSIKISSLESRCNFLSQDLHVENEKSSLVLNNEAGSNKRPSNVVAKLMGLEAFPDIMSADERTMIKIKSCLREDSVRRSSKAANEGKPSQISCSPDVSRKEPASPKLGIANSAAKPIPNPRFPLEPAPWRQQDTSQGSEKRTPKDRKASTHISNMPSSVYGEIEKRITELEFKKSGKDLRALKQILEAMQKTRQRLENQTEESEFSSQTSRSSLEYSSSNQDSRLSMWKDQQNVRQFSTSKGTIPIKRSESSIVIMKSAKVADKIRISRSSSVSPREIPNLQTLRQRDCTRNRDNSIHRQTTKDLMRRGKNLKGPSRVLPSTDEKNNSGGLEVEQTSKAPRRIKVEYINTYGRSSGMLSPRSQQKNHRSDRQSHPTTPSSDPGRARNPCSKQFKESGYSNRNLKQKSTNLYQGDTASVKSESNNSLESQIETEITSLAHSIEMNDQQHEEAKLRNTEAGLKECMPPRVDPATTALEQPSPVSVLDATFYEDESPSPVEKKLTTFKEDDGPSLDEEEWHIEDLNYIPNGTRSSHRKLEDTEHLAHNLRLFNTTPNEVATDHTPSFYESSNTDQQYIIKILMASGLLKDVSYIPIANQLSSLCHVINPNLFHVLEQTEERIELVNEEFNEANSWLKLNQKMHRKIVFDTVNEILVRKFSSEGNFSLGRKRMNRQELLKEVQLGVDRLQRTPGCSFDDEGDGLDRIITADMMHRSAEWTNYIGEIPALALDIERLIFKDLINEVTMCKVNGLHDWPQWHCRQLFTK
ncbi:hypothetical protein Adt_05369 [Abeliophyllum distichum]|uniref:DUF4378 domain-containing protein n=1 Tax=Abeliophyllum distichum TaxID=126358 RepID=A0ABD1V3Y3_9LAMI